MSYATRHKPAYRSKRLQSRAKEVYVSKILSQTAVRIREQQQQIAEDWDLFESGTLKSMLSGHFTVASSDQVKSLTMRYLTYYRFLDMADRRRKRKREGYHHYNRVLFGNIYNYTLGGLKHGFTKEVANKIIDEIQEAMDENPMLATLALKKLRK